MVLCPTFAVRIRIRKTRNPRPRNRVTSLRLAGSQTKAENRLVSSARFPDSCFLDWAQVMTFCARRLPDTLDFSLGRLADQCVVDSCHHMIDMGICLRFHQLCFQQQNIEFQNTTLNYTPLARLSCLLIQSSFFLMKL